MAQEKLPPQDIEAEGAVIACLIIDSDSILKVVSFLKGEDFSSEINQWIYQAATGP